MSQFVLPQFPAYTPSGDAGKKLLARIENAKATTQRRNDELADEIIDNAFMARHAPRVEWNKFVSSVFDWKQGEHVTMLGTTGGGKTTAMLGILHKRQYVTIFGTKPADANLDTLYDKGYHKMDRWQSLDSDEYPRRLLWPDARDLNADVNQRAVFSDALRRMFLEGHWAIGGDELGYLTSPKFLALNKEITQILIQGRSIGISMISATQRPSWVPLEVYSEATHLFLWGSNLKEDTDRLSHLGGRAKPAVIKQIMSRLEQYQFLYVNTRTGIMCRTHAPEIKVNQ